MSGIFYCKSFLMETIEGVHNFATDTLMIALFTGAAVFNQDVTAYSTTNEIPSGSGYTAGGQALALTSGYPKYEGGGAAVRYGDAQWVFQVAKPSVQWVFIYNASKANRGIMAIDMGSVHSIFGTFNWRFPLSAPPLIWQKAPGIS